MASTDLTTNYLKLWLQSDAASREAQQKFLMKGVETINAKASDVMRQINQGPDAWNLTVEWLDRRNTEYKFTGKLTTATLVLSGNLLGAAVTADSMKQHIRIGTILERPSDGLQVKVTATDYANKQCTVAAHGNSGALSNDASPVRWDILGEAGSDYNTDHQPKSTAAVIRYVGTQIHEETFEAPETWLNSRFEEIQNNLQDQLRLIVQNIRTKIARSALRIAPVYNSGYVTGHSVEAPTMTGLCQWPRILYAESANDNVYRNKNNNALSIDDLDNLVYYLEADEGADYGQGRWALCYNSVQQKPIAELLSTYRRMSTADTVIGFTASAYAAKNGKTFQLIPDFHMPPGMILLVDLDACTWGYYANDRMHVKDLATQNRTIRKLISCQTYGVVLRKTRASIGAIYGLPQSY